MPACFAMRAAVAGIVAYKQKGFLSLPLKLPHNFLTARKLNKFDHANVLRHRAMNDKQNSFHLRKWPGWQCFPHEILLRTCLDVHVGGFLSDHAGP